MEKTCSKCKTPKHFDAFGPNKKSKDGKQSWCRQCNSDWTRASRGSPRTDCQPYKPRKFEYVQDYIRKAKEACGCVRCGEKDAVALDFHHLRDKSFGLGGHSSCKRSLEEVKAEIAKCVVLCSNCHRKLHAGRFDLTEIHST